MRVLWTHNFDPENATSGVFMHTAARGLRSRGIDLELEYLGNLRSPSQIFAARKRVGSISAGFDIVHAQYGSACAIATAAAIDVPKVLTIRGSDWQKHGASFDFLYLHTRLASALTRISLGAYDGIITVSNRMSKSIAESCTRHIEVLPSPIDLTEFVPMDKSVARERLGRYRAGEKWVLFNSRWLANPIKRYALAQEAVSIAKRRRKDLRVQLATDLPHHDVALLTAASDLLLCTSENEGWPNSIKEALACNVPFVATDVSDLRELADIEPSCRVCSDDPVDLANAICASLEDSPPHNLRRFVEGMSLEAVSDRIIEIYESLLRR